MRKTPRRRFFAKAAFREPILFVSCLIFLSMAWCRFRLPSDNLYGDPLGIRLDLFNVIRTTDADIDLKIDKIFISMPGKLYPRSSWPRNVGYFPKERIGKQGKIPAVMSKTALPFSQNANRFVSVNKYMCNLPYVLKFKSYNIMYIDHDRLMITCYK